MLLAGNLFENQQTDLIAAVQKMPRLGIVRCPHDVAMQVLAQNIGILALYARWHCLSHEREGLMPVQSAQLDNLSVERETHRR
jgi:hypothetical protein